ncbi:sigma-70 family RNA polymerase sigma factor [Cereibacter sphaeroides f. sp. denitrificans]|nr:sigma-70 family RNA polymerase sigma factor [Cereibacter sphaeroides f. sp. denitrificans]
MSCEDMRALQTALAIAAQGGNEKAKAELVTAVEPLVRHFLRRATRNHGLDPEDVRSDLVETVFRVLPKYDPSTGPFGSYLATCMKFAVPDIVSRGRMLRVPVQASAKLRDGIDDDVSRAAAAAVSAQQIEIDEDLGLVADPDADRLTSDAARHVVAEEIAGLDDREREIIARRFTSDEDTDESLITQPDKQPGVVLELPPGIRPMMLLEGYMSDYPVHCAFCRQRQLHRKGILVLLEDGTKAMCGHCCAEEIGGKAAVASIERSVDRKVAVSEKKRRAASVAAGLTEILTLLDADFLPIERAINDTIDALRGMFPDLLRETSSQLAIARGGLVSVVKSATKPMKDKTVEEMLRRRRLALSAVSIGLDNLDDALAFFSDENLRQLFKQLRRRTKYDRISFDCGLMRFEWHEWNPEAVEYEDWYNEITLPRMEIPDRTLIRRLIS